MYAKYLTEGYIIKVVARILISMCYDATSREVWKLLSNVILFYSS